MRGSVPILLLLLATLLPAVPSAAAGDECVNVAVEHTGPRTGTLLNVFGVVLVGVMVGPSALFPDGAAVVVWVVPAECGVSAPCDDLPDKLRGLCHVDVNRPGLP